MSKGLEALKRIEKNTFPYTSTLYDFDDLKNDRETIKKELQELESKEAGQKIRYIDDMITFHIAQCPCCGKTFTEDENSWECNYCFNCGIKLKWD